MVVFLSQYTPAQNTSNPKIMIQGKMYMAFVAFILPMDIKDIKKASILPLSNGTESLNSDDEDETYINTEIETLKKSF